MCSPSNSASHIYMYTKIISTALISSRLDYCNSLLNNIAKRDLAKLQRVKKLSGTCSTRAPRFSPLLPLLKQLPFQFHIELILNCPHLYIVLYLHNNHPTWLVSCIFQISLGSSDHKFHNKCLKQNLTCGNVPFSVAAPTV